MVENTKQAQSTPYNYPANGRTTNAQLRAFSVKAWVKYDFGRGL